MWGRWGWGLAVLALLCTAPSRAQPPQAVAAAIAMLDERPHAGEEAWREPVNWNPRDLQRGDEVKDIVNLAGVAVVDAQENGS